MPKCNIVSIDNDKSSFSPKIVNFQNGQLQPDKENQLQCTAFTDSVNNSTIMTVATNKMIYVGEENNNNDLFHTLLTIRCKKTNTVRLIPINTISLNVHVPRVNTLLDSTLNDSVLGVKDLYKTFGSKKAKRKTEQIERMKLNVSSVEEELRQTVADIEIKAEELVSQTQDDSAKSYRPAINRNATNVEDVYDLNAIITKGELEALTELAEEVLTNDFGEDKLTPFVVAIVNKLKETGTDKLRKCQMLLYVDIIIKFFQTPIRKLTKNFTMDPFPDLIVKKILQQFTVLNNYTRSRPLSMRDKAICSVMILSLHILDYQVDLEPLSTSIGCGIKKLVDIAKVLGARLSKKSTSVVALSLPLPETSLNVSRRGKKKN